MLTGYKGLKRFRSVSGEKTLAFLILPTEQNAHSFDMVQEESIVEFDGDTYRIKQMSEKNKGQKYFKEVVAIHTFFDLIDGYVYEVFTGSKTFEAFLQFVFAGTGYTWDIIGTFYAQDWENLGDNNPIALFQDGLKRYGPEFTLNGTHLAFKQKIGNATDFQFRYSYNIKTINRSVNTNNLSTYIKGFGKKNEDGSYVVQSEYISPLDEANGGPLKRKHAKPVRDERYTTLEGLNERLQAEIKEVPEVSITLDFVDLRRAGFPYDVPNEGDDVFLIYEPRNLDLETRIMDITEEFTEFNDYPIKTDVTLTNFRNNMTDQFVGFSRTQKTVDSIMTGSKKIPYSALDDAVKRATEALQSAQTELEFTNGIIARDKTNPNHLVLFNSAGIGVSLDGGFTFRTAMTAEGFVADLITVGTMLFDRMQGGSLKLGQAYQNGVLEVWSDTDGNGTQEQVARVDDDGAYFPVLGSARIRGDVENTWLLGDATYYINIVNGDDNNNGLSWVAAKKNFQAFIDGIPKNLNGYAITLLVRGDVLGGINLRGYHNGELIIIADTLPETRRPRILGPSVFENLYAGRFQILGYEAHGDESTVGQAMFTATFCQGLRFYDVKVYGNDKSPDAFWFNNCQFAVEECHAYGISDRGLYASNLSHGIFRNNHGSVPVALLVESGSIVTGEGTRWDGSVLRLGNSYLGGNNTDVWAIDTGEVAPAPPPESSEQTATYTSAGGDSWSSVGGYNDNKVTQGDWGYGQQTGLWYFDLTALRGKTIISAMVTVTRNSGGSSSARTVYIRTHRYISRASRPAGTPAVSGNYAAGSMAVGETKTIDVTALVQANIANGSIDTSLGAYITGATDYMNLASGATLVVRYK
jgi:phage minor structural protein